jgi:hypothetical protein
MKPHTFLLTVVAILVFASILFESKAQTPPLPPPQVIPQVNPTTATLDPLVDIRYCGIENIKRNPDGTIHRAAFQKQIPCPSTGLQKGACPRWAKDHSWPLIKGGCDAVWNMAWMNAEIKSAAGPYPKDRWEQKVYPPNTQVVTLPPVIQTIIPTPVTTPVLP